MPQPGTAGTAHRAGRTEPSLYGPGTQFGRAGGAPDITEGSFSGTRRMKVPRRAGGSVYGQEPSENMNSRITLTATSPSGYVARIPGNMFQRFEFLSVSWIASGSAVSITNLS